jgi:hypothetical protein
MRDSMVFNSCLLAQDIGNIYGVINGKNGYSWKSLQEYHNLLDCVNIDEFRKIGLSHIDNDIRVLFEFYQNLIELYRRIRP